MKSLILLIVLDFVKRSLDAFIAFSLGLLLYFVVGGRFDTDSIESNLGQFEKFKGLVIRKSGP